MKALALLVIHFPGAFLRFKGRGEKEVYHLICQLFAADADHFTLHPLGAGHGN